MGKSTISMAMFNSYVKLPGGIFRYGNPWCLGHPPILGNPKPLVIFLGELEAAQQNFYDLPVIFRKRQVTIRW
jgi:hypothetical protein